MAYCKHRLTTHHTEKSCTRSLPKAMACPAPTWPPPGAGTVGASKWRAARSCSFFFYPYLPLKQRLTTVFYTAFPNPISRGLQDSPSARPDIGTLETFSADARLGPHSLGLGDPAMKPQGEAFSFVGTGPAGREPRRPKRHRVLPQPHLRRILS